MKNKEYKFKIGDKACKPKGYKFPCTIVSVFETVNGNVRLVAEMDEYGLLHIFNEDQLEHYVVTNEYDNMLNLPKIEILNSEGPILVAYKMSDGLFKIFDQYKEFVTIFNKKTFEKFIMGDTIVIDSKKQTWSYKNSPDSMKESLFNLINFIN